jgi:hypothetical protein
MSAALVSDGAGGFVLLLVALLAMMLLAVIRAPGQEVSPSENAEDVTRPLPAVPALPRSAYPQPRPARPQARPGDVQPGSGDVQPGSGDVQARAAAAIARRPPGWQHESTATMPPAAVAAGQHGKARYPARHVVGTVPRPEVSGGPPWEPAPRPPESGRP